MVGKSKINEDETGSALAGYSPGVIQYSHGFGENSQSIMLSNLWHLTKIKN
jgi:hypothetical protein